MIEFIHAQNLTDCQRLFHGRGHYYEGLSHVNVDWLSPVVLITLYQVVDEQWLHEQAQALHVLIPQCTSVQVQKRYEKFAPTHTILGENVTSTQVVEDEQKYHIVLGKAQNTGLFLDMRNGRSWVKSNAKDKTILNLFSYTCAFSVAAIAGGAHKTVNIDVSKAALTKGRENHHLNSQDTKKVVFEPVDIFKSNSRIRKHGPYDLIISDPPTLQFGRVNIVRDYAKIIRKIPQWLKPGGELMLCLNSPDLSDDFLLNEVATHCPDCIYVERIAPPDVYKEAHQGKGLKTIIFKYMPTSE